MLLLGLINASNVSVTFSKHFKEIGCEREFKVAFRTLIVFAVICGLICGAATSTYLVVENLLAIFLERNVNEFIKALKPLLSSAYWTFTCGLYFMLSISLLFLIVLVHPKTKKTIYGLHDVLRMFGKNYRKTQERE